MEVISGTAAKGNGVSFGHINLFIGGDLLSGEVIFCKLLSVQ